MRRLITVYEKDYIILSFFGNTIKFYSYVKTSDIINSEVNLLDINLIYLENKI